jgi:Domain of unknown function (DUF5664)
VTSGKKFDAGKPDLSLIPLSALEEEARGFMLGAEKYGRYNYCAGLEATRLLAAALRHIHAVLQGDDLDPESGAHHLGHARCCLAMYLETRRLGTLKDNRYTAGGQNGTASPEQGEVVAAGPASAHLGSGLGGTVGPVDFGFGRVVQTGGAK